jgi:hypothetical protein
VLTFAQAVGSPEGLLKAACSQLQNLALSVQLPEQTVDVQLGAGAFYFFSDEPLTLGVFDLGSTDHVCSVESRQQRKQLQRLVAQHIGDLLHIAHMLRLQPLLDAMHDFVLWATAGVDGLLYGVLKLVFTDAVLEAAIGTGTVSKEAYINSVLAKPCGLTPEYAACHKLFRRTSEIEPVAGQEGALRFEARLLQDFRGGKAGDSLQDLIFTSRQ